jgi:hypothetical protein
MLNPPYETVLSWTDSWHPKQVWSGIPAIGPVPVGARWRVMPKMTWYAYSTRDATPG